MNIRELKKIMINTMRGNSFNYEISEILGVSYATASNKMTGKSKLKRSEKTALINHYKMNAKQIKEVFGDDEK